MSDEPYASPLSSLSKAPANKSAYYVVSTTKFVVLSIFLGGLYWVYWYYRQWKGWRQVSGVPVMAWLRALFAVFFIYSLFLKINDSLLQSGKVCEWRPRLLAVSLIVVIIGSWVISYDMTLHDALITSCLVLIMQIALMLRAQRVINCLCDDPQGMSNRRVTWANAVCVVSVMLMWAVGLLSLLIQLNGV